MVCTAASQPAAPSPFASLLCLSPAVRAVQAGPSRGDRMRQALKRRRVALDDEDDGRQDLEDPIEEPDGQLGPPGTPAAARRKLPPGLAAAHTVVQGARSAKAATVGSTRFQWDDADVALLLDGMEKYGRVRLSRSD